MLNAAEKRFVQRGLRRNAPIPMLAHHIFICRQLEIEPDFLKLDAVFDEVQTFVGDPESK